MDANDKRWSRDICVCQSPVSLFPTFRSTRTISHGCEIISNNPVRSGTCFSKQWLDDRKAVLKNGSEDVPICNLRHAPHKVDKRPPVYLRENGGFDSSAAAFPWTAQLLSLCVFLGKEIYSLVNFCLETTTPVTKNRRE